jgi:urease accessory protein
MTIHQPQPFDMGTQSTTGGWQGHLALDFSTRSGQTIPRHQATAPLKMQRPFYPTPQTCQSVIVHTAGGMVAGDELRFDISAQAHTQALVTTAAAHKVYRSETGAIAQQRTHITLAEQAVLEWFPQETIVFDGAQYHQQTRVDLAPGALWWGWDIYRFGRSARGEAFTSGHWRSTTEVWCQAVPLWIDRQSLLGGSSVIESPHGLAGQPVIGSFVLVGTEVTPAQVEQARQAWAQMRNGLSESSGETGGESSGEIGVTRLAQGLLCRYRGPSSQAARSWFVNIWQILKPQIMMATACPPRVWGV